MQTRHNKTPKRNTVWKIAKEKDFISKWMSTSAPVSSPCHAAEGKANAQQLHWPAPCLVASANAASLGKMCRLCGCAVIVAISWVEYWVQLWTCAWMCDRSFRLLLEFMSVKICSLGEMSQSAPYPSRFFFERTGAETKSGLLGC